ncbi:MAG TPA: cation:proton antiporter [Pyrinomonadaceae bacterium]|nr:cation:proton antiporter [Pyrinomonadaceae bacterium]
MTYFLATAIEGPAKILLTLFVMLAVAKIMAEIFERLRQPSVVGEILAGVLIGPSLLGWFTPNEITDTLAEIGVIFLLFTVGLETKPASIFHVGKRAIVVAVLGVVLPFIAGWLLMRAWHGSGVEAMFLGTAMVATSVGITARVLSTMGVLDALTSRIILGAAVIDDILGLMILALVSSLAVGPVNYVSIATTVILAVGFTAFMVLVGAPVVKRMAPRIENLRGSHALFVAALLLCLGISVTAAYIGVAAIVGAFLAGMTFAEVAEERPTMLKQMSGVTEFLVPFFLVNIGMQLRLSIFQDSRVVAFAILVTLVAVISKLLGCGAGAWGLGWKRVGQVGMGMVPRGEVGIVVAQIGLGMAVISDSLYAVVLMMAVATTLIAPPFLRILYARESKHERTVPT